MADASNAASGYTAETPRQLRAVFDLLSITEQRALDPGTPEKIVHWLYRILDTLDSKTSHLLRFASIVLAAQIFLASTMIRTETAPRWAKVILLVLPLITLGGTFRSLQIFRVKWPFLGWQPHDSLIVDPADLANAMRREFAALAKVCDKRHRAHNGVLNVTQLSVVLLGLSVCLTIWVLVT